MHKLELGLDMSLLWNRMTFSRIVAELGGSVTDDRDGILSFSLRGRRFTMEAGPSPIFRIVARFSVPGNEMAAFMGAAAHLGASGCSAEVTVDPRSETASFAYLGFAYGDQDLADTLRVLTRRIDLAAFVLAGLAGVMGR